MTYKINDLIQYGTDGVCRISEISEQEFRGKKLSYYILSPVFNKNATIYVPVENEELVSHMRYALSSEELTDIIKGVSTEDCEWIDDEDTRKLRFGEIIHSGNCRDIARMIKMLFLRRQDQLSIGKKLHSADEKFFRDAERLFYDEVAVAFNIKPAEVNQFISEMLQ